MAPAHWRANGSALYGVNAGTENEADAVNGSSQAYGIGRANGAVDGSRSSGMQLRAGAAEFVPQDEPSWWAQTPVQPERGEATDAPATQAEPSWEEGASWSWPRHWQDGDGDESRWENDAWKGTDAAGEAADISAEEEWWFQAPGFVAGGAQPHSSGGNGDWGPEAGAGGWASEETSTGNWTSHAASSVGGESARYREQHQHYQQDDQQQHQYQYQRHYNSWEGPHGNASHWDNSYGKGSNWEGYGGSRWKTQRRPQQAQQQPPGKTLLRFVAATLRGSELKTFGDAEGFVALALVCDALPKLDEVQAMMRKGLVLGVDYLARQIEEKGQEEFDLHQNRLRVRLRDNSPSKDMAQASPKDVESSFSYGNFAQEIVVAKIEDADALILDEPRLRRSPPFSSGMGSSGGGHGDQQGGSWWNQPGSHGRMRSLRTAGQRLQNLLNFYFDPFNLQHNRYLLDIVFDRAGSKETGPLMSDKLENLEFELRDLMGLGRIASELWRLRINPNKNTSWVRVVEPLKHLTCDGKSGLMRLASPPEIRRFLPAKSVPSKTASESIRYMCAANETKVQAPPGTVSFVSQSVWEALADVSKGGEQRRSRLKRQVLLHHTDFVCLQGFDARGEGAQLATSIKADGFQWVCSGTAEEANTIFWDESRWVSVREVRHDHGVAVDLSPIDDRSCTIRIVCVRPDVPKSGDLPSGLIEKGDGALLVGADLWRLGGAEAVAVAEELLGLRSLMEEVIDYEISAPVVGISDSKDSEVACTPVPVLDKASNKVRLHEPDGVLFRGLAPAAALSGHTIGYLKSLEGEDIKNLFPSSRLPIVGSFYWEALCKAQEKSDSCEG